MGKGPPSGAGKTTWCRTHAGAKALLEALPDPAAVPTEPRAAARFWVERNVARWHEVLAREARDGLVVVDTDPFKLHYVWTLFKTGQIGEVDWTMQRDVARRDADPSRTRRNFERHILLRDSLLRWYAAIDRLEPGRVVFGLPDAGITPDLIAKGKRAKRSGLELFDHLMSELGAV